MSIIYPLTMPGTPPGPRAITLAHNFMVGEFDSPFTGQSQIYEQQGSLWTAKIDLPPMSRATASPWLAFLAALNGRSGTFLLGDPLGTSPLSTAGGAPVVSGAGQTGKQLLISGLTGTLKAGDYFQIGNENFLLYSEQLQNAAWFGEGTPSFPVVTGNATADPNGNVDAAQVAFPATGAGQVNDLRQSTTLLPNVGETWAFSIWLKAAGAVSIQMQLGQSTGQNSIVTSQSVTTSWQRFTILSGPIAAIGTGFWLVRLTQPASQGAVTVFAWGAQLERASSAGPYVTTTSAIGTGKRLHQNLTDAVGGATNNLDIFPRLRESPTLASGVRLASPLGTFRLDANLDQYMIETAGFYNISFGAREAF